MMLYDAERIPALAGDPQTTLRSQIVEFVRAHVEKIVREIANRVQFLNDVGLEYLTLDRTSVTLSGGETVVLTAREKEILKCLADGMGTGAIAKKLFIATVTVRNHVQSILHKLDVHTKLAAVVFAYQHELI